MAGNRRARSWSRLSKEPDTSPLPRTRGGTNAGGSRLQDEGAANFTIPEQYNGREHAPGVHSCSTTELRSFGTAGFEPATSRLQVEVTPDFTTPEIRLNSFMAGARRFELRSSLKKSEALSFGRRARGSPTPTRTGISGLGNLCLFRLDDGASVLKRVIHVFAGHCDT